MHFVYILYSKSINQTYVGETTNLDRRLSEHPVDNTRTTNRAKDYKLIWFAAFDNTEKAKQFERYLKSHSGRVLMRKRLIGDLM